MARAKLILQALNQVTHSNVLKNDLLVGDILSGIFSSAFAVKSGIDEIAGKLASYKDQVEFFIGIRNNITSKQAMQRLLELSLSVYAVDFGASTPKFHPKLYYTENRENVKLLVGSANLTFSGLNNNIEASVLSVLDKSDQEDATLFEATKSTFSKLKTDYPDHVFRLKDIDHINELFETGRLADEEVRNPKPQNSVLRTKSRDKLELMNFPFKCPEHPRKITNVGKASTEINSATGWILVWERKGLTKSDLNIPTGSSTNPTWSISVQKGAIEGIDHRHYFRDEVFNSLAWAPDTGQNRSHYERAYACFELIVKGISIDTFNLKLSHNTRVDSVAYKKNNAMTRIDWGDAREHIASSDLRDRTLKLYQNTSDATKFIMEID